jgi:hypothetical protein
MKPDLLQRLPYARLLVCAVAALVMAGTADAQQKKTSRLAPFPNDMSVPGLRAMKSLSDNPELYKSILPEEVENRVRDYVQEMRKQGLTSRSGVLSMSAAPTNVRANDPTGDRVGETQAEVAVAVYGDTVVVGWNDSKGFTAGFTISSFGYSTDGGATFIDGGNVPLQTATDQAFGDPGIDTDEKGNWYYNQIYTKTGQQNIGVHHGKFVGGVLVWDTPVMASIGTSATGALDKCLLACDRVTGNVYVAYTRFTAVPQIEIVRSTTKGATWDAPVVLDNTTTPTTSKQSARPFCGPNGEVYVVWEKGANLINCPDPTTGNVSNTTGVIAFTRSLNNGLSYDPFTIIGTVDHSWTWSGPGDLRERANDFPDIAVDRSGGPFNGNIYVTWHESAPWTANLSAGPVRAEAADAANNNPGTAELFNVGEDVTGTINVSTDFDYWQFSATQGQSLLFNLDPNTFNCGISGSGGAGMRLRLFATQSPYPNPTGFPDSLLAASALGAFAQRIVWTAPKTGTYLVRLQRSAGPATFPYRLRVRNLTFGSPSPARDARDVVVVRSTNQGASWSTEQLINDDPAGLENRRPFICVDGLGHVHTFWHDARKPGLGSNAALTSIFGTTSRDGGITWTPNYQVTDELSFFSFNTLAVPNLGDYNQAAATANGLVYAAWSDQRLSTGDVRTPGTNTFTAGLGPEAYTAKVSFDFTIACPPETTVYVPTPFTRTFTITNTGKAPDNYSYNVTDVAGYLGGAITGTTGLIDPGAAANVTVTVTPNASLTDVITFSVNPLGDPDGKTCTTTVMAFNFVFLSQHYVKIDKNQLSDGNIHSNAKIEFGGRSTAGQHTGNLSARDDITIRNFNTIVGNATAKDDIYLLGNAKITGVKTAHASVAAITPARQSFTAGGKNKTVPMNGSVTLAPGSYGRVEVRNKGRLHLSAGDYFMKVLDLEIAAKLVIDVTNGPANVNVVNDLQIGHRAQIDVIGGSTDMVKLVTLQDPKVDIGGSAIVRGIFIAQDAEVHFGSNCRFKGSLFADVITVDPNSKFVFHTSAAVFPKEDAVETAEKPVAVITDYELAQNYPNPFNPSTMISFALPAAGKATVNIYDLTGQLIRTLADREMPAGRQTLRWNGRNQSGTVVAAGIYLYRIVVQGKNGEAVFTETKRMTFLK